MARNKQVSRRTVQATADGYENFVARVGMQTPNQHSASTYRANFTSRNRMLVEWSYRSSWLIGEPHHRPGVFESVADCRLRRYRAGGGSQ